MKRHGKYWSDTAADTMSDAIHEINEHWKETFGREVTQEELDDLCRGHPYPEQPTLDEIDD